MRLPARPVAVAAAAGLLVAITGPAMAAGPRPDRPARAASLDGWHRTLSVDERSRPSRHTEELPSASPDGRFVAFLSSGSLVRGATCDGGCLHVVDLAQRTTEYVAVAQGRPDISADGRFLVYASSADHPGPDGRAPDPVVFLHDRQLATTTIISATAAGAPAMPSDSPRISADGRYVVYRSGSPDLVPDDGNGVDDVFLYDRTTGATSLLSRTPGGQPANGSSGPPTISADGSVVAYESHASDLVADDTNGAVDVFVRDRTTRVTRLVSRDVAGQPAGQSSAPDLADNGRHVVFQSAASDLVPGDTNDRPDVFTVDQVTGDVRLVSQGLDGQTAEGASISPATTAGGRYVAFVSSAADLVAGVDPLGVPQVFLHDLTTGQTVLVTRTLDGGVATAASADPALAANGRQVVLSSLERHLVRYDDPSSDLFLFTRSAIVPGS